MDRTQPPRLIVNFRSGFLIGLFVLLNVPLLYSSLQANAFTFYALLGVNLLLTSVAVATRKQVSFPVQGLDFRQLIPLFIQGTVQFSIFIYVILMNPSNETRALVLARIPLIFYQLFFGFVFDYLLMVWRGKSYRPEFYIIPMVLSINLFFWILDNYFILHLLLIIMGILIKNFVVRQNPDGRVTHIFNPSFIVLTFCAIVVFSFNLHQHIYDSQIAVLYDATPDFDIYVFCVGCITLWLPDSYVEAMGAYTIIMLLDYISQNFFGYRLFFRLAGGSVLIAIMLGISDPQTSPQSKRGKFFFGVSYGLCLTLVNFLLVLFNSGARFYYAKILSIPVLNIFSRKFDVWFESTGNKKIGYYQGRILALVVFALIFFSTHSMLEAVETDPSLVYVIANKIRMALHLTAAIPKHHL
jgi:hypothetical protein